MNSGLLHEPLMIHAVLASTHPFTPSYQYIYIYIYQCIFFTNVIVIFYRARHARSNNRFNYLLYNRVSKPKMSHTVNFPLVVLYRTITLLRFNDYFSFEYSINSAIIATIYNPKCKLNWLSNYVEEKDMLLSTFKKYVNRHIPDNEFYITTPEQSETNSDEFYVIDDNGPSTSKSTVEIEILNYINSKNTNLDMLNNYHIIKMLFIKYNSILPSSAPVERMFSIATNINKPKRNKLNDTNFELLVLLKENSLY